MKKRFEFHIQPGGLNAKPGYSKVIERPLMKEKPTDANQLAPSTTSPVPAHHRMAGGCK